MEFGVDADGVGEGEGRDRGEVWEDEGGDVWEVDGFCFEDLDWRDCQRGVFSKRIGEREGEEGRLTSFKRSSH